MRPRRRWWQRICRGLMAAMVLLAAAYVTLPFWAPCGYLRRALAGQMSRQMGVDVRIGGMSLSWSRGVELRDLTIASPEGFGPELMAVVRRVRAEFSPVNLLINRRVAWMELDRPELFVRIDEAGRTNLEPLRRLDFDVETGRTSIHRAVARVRLPGHDRLLRLDIGDMQILAGRLRRIGRITMSAALRQEGDPAPVSLYAGPGGEAVAATVSFTFANVDLAQLNLPKLLGLPLARLGGRCSGSLELQVNRQLVADQVTFGATIRRLDAQPADGRKLPVIDEAWFRVSAAYDPLAAGGGRTLLRSVSIRLPGVDLGGHAVLAGDIRFGSLESIRSLHLEGVVHPQRLAGLLTGRAELPAGLAVDGPLRVKASLEHEGPLVAFDLTADATGAAIRRDGRTLKPRDRRLRLELAGRFDERTGGVTVHRNQVLLGPNRFIGLGRVDDVRPLARFDKWKLPGTLAEALAAVPPVQWQGSWEVTDLPGLLQFWPAAAEALGGVELRGPLTGGWRLDRPRGRPLSVLVDLNVPGETHLAVGGWFVKPPGKSMSLSLGGTIDGGSLAVRDVDFALAVAGGSLHLQGARVRLADGVLDAGGERFLVNRIESLLACLPGLASAGLTGRADGEFTFRLDEDRSRAKLTVRLADVDATWASPAGASGRWARWFGGHFRGRLDVDAACTLRPAETLAELTLDASDLAYAAAGAVRRVKPAGTPFRLALTARVNHGGGKLTRVEVLRSLLTIGRSRVALSGAATVPAKAKTPAPSPAPWGGLPLETFQARIEAVCVLDAAVKGLLPELDELAGRHGLRGEAAVTIRLAGDADSARLTCRVDANALAVGPIAWKAPDPRGGPDPLARLMVALGPVGKPAGMPASLRLEAAVPADLSGVKINDLRARAGSVSLLGDGEIRLAGKPGAPRRDGPSRKVRLAAAHLAVWTRRLEDLHRLVPRVRPYRLAGDGIVEAEWTDGDGGRLRYARLAARALQGRFRGKDVRLSGEVLLTDLAMDEAGRVRLAGARTDGLEFRIGDNHGWLIAELADLPARPSGTFHLLGERIDAQDLIDWLATADAAGRPASRPAEKKSRKLTREQVEALQRRAADMLAAARPLLMRCRVAGRASVESLRTFDAQIGQYYETRNVELDCSVDSGHVSLRYAAGLYGGCVRTRLDVHLSDAVPIVTQEQDLSDVIATESMQPQLARYFPGNTVYGYFNRAEKVTYALRDLVANTIDPRYRLMSEGEAKTVTLDGLVIGRAAPRFITRIFPGLNLTRYRYRRMTAFARYRRDGTAVNDMIFDGQNYDMYMEGTTDVGNVGRYEIGIILLGTPQTAEWNHTYRQGRIPILKFKARIENGKMYDVEVSYPWPTETAYVIFLKNNVFYRIWLAARNK